MLSYTDIPLRVSVLCLIGSLLSANISTGQDSTFELNQEEILQSIELSDLGQYRHFTANSNYLVWFNYTDGDLYIYSPTKDSTQQIQLRRGRGPGEYSQFSALAIKENDDLFVLDQANRKYIKIDTKTGSKVDIAIGANSIVKVPFRMGAFQNKLVLVDGFSKETFFYVQESHNKPETAINMDGKVTLPERPNPARREGEMVFLDNRMIYATYFYPTLYVNDLRNNETIDKSVFAESKVEQPAPKTSNEGVSMSSAPTEVSLLTHDVAGVPLEENHVLLLLEGKDVESGRQFSMSTLYEYDYQEDKFIQGHKLGIKAEAITRQGRNLYVFSEKSNAIYKYRFQK